MQTILAISQNVFRKALRSRIFTVLLFFALGLIFLSRIFEFLTFTAEIKLIKDIGLASIAFFTVLITIFLSGESITSEIEEKTIYTLLSKPVNKQDLILGKFLGIVWAILATLATTGVAFFILIYLKQHTIPGIIFESLFFTFLEAAVISSIGIMFSSLSSSTSTSTIFTFFIYILGHFNPQLRFLGEKVREASGKWTIKIIVWILPNLEYFNIREKASRNIPIPASLIGKTTLYAFIYICAMLTLAYLILKKREF